MLIQGTLLNKDPYEYDRCTQKSQYRVKREHHFKTENYHKSYNKVKSDRYWGKKRIRDTVEYEKVKVQFDYHNQKVDWDPYDPLGVGYKDGKGIAYHDKALRRADISNYHIPQFENLNKTLFIKGLSSKTTEDKITAAFEKYGTILRVDLIRELITRRSKGYWFIEFENFIDAKNAYESRY